MVRTPDGVPYRRNRRHLNPTSKKHDPKLFMPEYQTFNNVPNKPIVQLQAAVAHIPIAMSGQRIASPPVGTKPNDDVTTMSHSPVKTNSDDSNYVIRSGRVVKPKVLYLP